MPDSSYFKDYFEHLHNRLQTANVADLEQAAQLASQANQQNQFYEGDVAFCSFFLLCVWDLRKQNPTKEKQTPF